MSYNVFGSGNPSIMGTGTPDSDETILYHSKFETPTFVDPNTYSGTAPITGHVNYGWLGDHSYFEILVRVHRYDNSKSSGSMTSKVAYQKLRSYHGQKVYFRPHVTFEDGAGLYISDEEDNKIKFFCLAIPEYEDGLPYSRNALNVLLKLYSTDFVYIDALATGPA